MTQYLIKKEAGRLMAEDGALSRHKQRFEDPGLTKSFGIAVVPDSVFDLSSGVLADVYKLNGVLVSYSMRIPYLMPVLHTTLKTMQTVDPQKLDDHL